MYPKIGIRPVIDGRRLGVRESLETQTTNMAKAAAELISENLRYPDGSRVACVISDVTIGGSAEAAMCAEKFSKENVCATLSVTPCWCYGSETMDMDPKTIKAVWGFNGTERPGAVYLAAVMSAHAQRGLPAFSIYGRDVCDSTDATIPCDVREKILRFAKAALAAGTMNGKSYVNVGSVSMGIAGSYIDASFFQRYLGIRAEWVDMTEISRRVNLGIYDKDEYEKALAWVKKNCRAGLEINKQPHTAEQKEKEWEFIVKLTLICRDILTGNKVLADMGFIEESMGRNGIAGGFQGQRMWTDYLPNADFTEAILNSTFDWNGKRKPTVFATENDTLNGCAMLFVNLLTNMAPIFADVRTYWSPDAVKRVTGYTPEGRGKNGFIHLINSGAAALDGCGAVKDAAGNPVMKEWWNMNDADIAGCLEATTWSPANLEYFRGGGYSSTYSTKGEMPVTLVRVNMIDGLGPAMQLAEGYTVDLPDAVDKTLLDRTDRTWPSTWFAPIVTGNGAFTDVYGVMANWGANHGAFVYGHAGADLITLASMLRIPVSLHNVAKERIFRPHSWAAFGTEGLESADYRACANYGPLYK